MAVKRRPTPSEPVPWSAVVSVVALFAGTGLAIWLNHIFVKHSLATTDAAHHSRIVIASSMRYLAIFICYFGLLFLIIRKNLKKPT